MWTLLFVSGILLLALLPWRVRVLVAFDLYTMRFALRVRLWGIIPLRLYLRQENGQWILQGKPLRLRPKKDAERAGKATPLLRRLPRALRGRVRFNVLLGLPSPFVTALVCGVTTLWSSDFVWVRCYPSREEACRGYLSCNLHFRPLRLLA